MLIEIDGIGNVSWATGLSAVVLMLVKGRWNGVYVVELRDRQSSRRVILEFPKAEQNFSLFFIVAQAYFQSWISHCGIPFQSNWISFNVKSCATKPNHTSTIPLTPLYQTVLPSSTNTLSTLISISLNPQSLSAEFLQTTRSLSDSFPAATFFLSHQKQSLATEELAESQP